MSETFFISDNHWGHAKILEFESKARPFSTVEEMNEAMVERWNSVVKKHDKVYHLGDFCFGRKNIEIAARLNGNKCLILGNHDCYNASEYLKYFKSVHGAMYWNGCILTHIPVHPEQLEGRYKLNCHGHLHSRKMDNPKYLNCSAEQNNLTPIHIDVILKAKEDLNV